MLSRFPPRSRLLIGLPLFALAVASGTVCAAIYKYQDENGKWHFTDEKFEAGEGAEQHQLQDLNVSRSEQDRWSPVVAIPEGLCAADENTAAFRASGLKGNYGKKGDFSISTEGPKENLRIYARNDYAAPVTVMLWLKQHANMGADRKLPLQTEVAPHTTMRLATLAPLVPGRPWKYRYQYRYKLGTLNPRHSPNCYYLPPIGPDVPLRISQAFNGRFSHHSDHSRYAVDIAMPLGTPVVAARGGIVIERTSDYVLNGLDQQFLRKANAVRILHSDGTIAVYAHLQFRTMKFHEGEYVGVGQVIGRSGNTGYSTGPHLHFAVHGNMGMKLNSLPFRFLVDGRPEVPQRGMVLLNQPVKEEQPEG